MVQKIECRQQKINLVLSSKIHLLDYTLRAIIAMSKNPKKEICAMLLLLFAAVSCSLQCFISILIDCSILLPCWTMFRAPFGRVRLDDFYSLGIFAWMIIRKNIEEKAQQSEALSGP